VSDFDLDRLGDLWRTRPDPAEMERLQRAGDAVARRARWGHLSDLALSALVSVAVIALVWSNPTFKTGLVGGAAILLMLSSHLRQRQLRKVELEGLTGSSEQMIEQSIGRVEATLKRIRFGLVSVAPGFLVGIGFAATLSNGAGSVLARLRENQTTVALVAVAIVAGLVALSLYFLNMTRRSRAELDRLTTLRDAYRRETEDSEA
jgi:divalent metal cation (Fe/Co/Zn/Cd) transporter